MREVMRKESMEFKLSWQERKVFKKRMTLQWKALWLESKGHLYYREVA